MRIQSSDIIVIPYATCVPNLVSIALSIAELARGKMPIVNQSVTQSPTQSFSSLSDMPGTEVYHFGTTPHGAKTWSSCLSPSTTKQLLYESTLCISWFVDLGRLSQVMLLDSQHLLHDQAVMCRVRRYILLTYHYIELNISSDICNICDSFKCRLAILFSS